MVFAIASILSFRCYAILESFWYKCLHGHATRICFVSNSVCLVYRRHRHCCISCEAREDSIGFHRGRLLHCQWMGPLPRRPQSSAEPLGFCRRVLWKGLHSTEPQSSHTHTHTKPSFSANSSPSMRWFRQVTADIPHSELAMTQFDSERIKP